MIRSTVQHTPSFFTFFEKWVAIVDAPQFWGNLDNNELRQRLGMQQFSKYRHYYRPEYTPLMA
jgi:hypothetical protein